MAQFNLTWGSSEVNASSNSVGQRVSYRKKGTTTWLTAGFTPTNDLDTVANSIQSPVLLDNNVYEFKVEAICTQGGPTPNDNGVKEQIAFGCISPTIENNSTTSQATLNLANTDITKVQFTLRKSSDNSIVYGPTVISRVGDIVTAVATGLTPSTNYYWQTILFANINGVEVNSGMGTYLNSVCGPNLLTTDAAPVQDLIWVADTQVCEKEGGFGTVKTISSLSSPSKSWYDSTNNRVYVADHDDPLGNVYWFNPDTATTAADMTHSTAVNDNKLYNCFIDGDNRRIYFVGANSGGLIVYDIDTNTSSVVAFGVNGDFSRIMLTVTSNRIYCNNGSTSIIIIDRATLAILSTVTIASIPTPTHFTPDTILVEGNGKLYAINSNNSSIGTIGVYNMTLTTLITEITLPGAAVWAGGFSHYWQTGFYDPTSGNLFVGDIGSSQRFIIDTTTDTVTNTSTITNKGGKANAISTWTVNPVTDELMFILTTINNSTDTTPIRRTYKEDRVTHLYTVMFEDQSYTSLSHIYGTNKVVGVDAGQTFWNDPVGYNTDGSIMILSTSTGLENTGRLITTTLKQVDANNSNAPTGVTKDNLPGDPDYVAPVISGSCAVTTSLTCPDDLVTTFAGTTLDYEFAIASSVRNNSNIKKIQVFAYNTNTASVEGSPQTITAPFNTNYYSGQFTALGGSNYTIQIRYLDVSDAVLATC